MLQFTKGLSVKASLIGFSAIVAVVFICLGVVTYISVGSLRDITDSSTSNTVLLEHTAEMGKMHDSIRGDIVTYILAF